MTLTDTGPLVAMLDKGDSSHARCTMALGSLSKPLVTTWPCVAETMHLVGKSIGHRAQDELWDWIETGLVQIHELSAGEMARMRVLMAQYADRPMDLADASLVAAAESVGVKRVFTIDSDFLFYRLANSATLRLVP